MDGAKQPASMFRESGREAVAKSRAAAELPVIHIVIVNYNTAPLVLKHLPLIAAEADNYPGSIIHVVDNASPNGDAGVLDKALADFSGFVTQVQMHCSPVNGGFAAGNNVALRPIFNGPSGNRPDFVLLMNPDAFPRPGALRELVDHMIDRPGVGVAGARLEGEDGVAQVSAFRFFTPASELDGAARLGPLSRLLSKWRTSIPPTDGVVAADWVCGAAALIRREVFEGVGLLDDGYFMYYEETDLMLRAKRAGWFVDYVGQSRFVHLVGRSSGVVGGRCGKDQLTPDYVFASRRRYFSRNHGPATAFLADICWLAGASLHIARQAISGKPTNALRADVRSFLAHMKRTGDNNR
ncbi:MAG: glycosyltransferase [Alphaproteobacteria bacterium]|nr:glycosyltransferase [Alphaproteobacteria bacterium]